MSPEDAFYKLLIDRTMKEVEEGMFHILNCGITPDNPEMITMQKLFDPVMMKTRIELVLMILNKTNKDMTKTAIKHGFNKEELEKNSKFAAKELFKNTMVKHTVDSEEAKKYFKERDNAKKDRVKPDYMG